jgi:hypothetical protein
MSRSMRIAKLAVYVEPDGLPFSGAGKCRERTGWPGLAAQRTMIWSARANAHAVGIFTGPLRRKAAHRLCAIRSTPE